MQLPLNRLHLAVVLSLLVTAGFATVAAGKNVPKAAVDPNDVTVRLFHSLDDSFAGKFDDYVLADLYTDASTGQEYRHILHIDYDKSRTFGRLNIYIRSVAKMTPEQHAIYTPKEIFDFAQSDLEKFIKTDPGPYGGTGDLYFHSLDGGPLVHAAINNEMEKRYADIVTQFVIPALEKDHKAP